MSRYQRFTVGGGYNAPTMLLSFLNEMPREYRVLAINQGKYGKWHGLYEENEAGYEIIVDTSPTSYEIKVTGPARVDFEPGE